MARFRITNYFSAMCNRTRLVHEVNETANQDYASNSRKKVDLLAYFLERQCPRTVSNVEILLRILLKCHFDWHKQRANIMYGEIQRGETANVNFKSVAAIIPPKKHIPPSVSRLSSSSPYTRRECKPHTGPSGKRGLVVSYFGFDTRCKGMI